MDMLDKSGVITMNLIAWARAQFENNATSSLYERGDNGCVFIGDEISSCIWWSIHSVHELREDMVWLQVILNNFAEAASRICCGRPSAARPSRRTACVKDSQCTIMDD